MKKTVGKNDIVVLIEESGKKYFIDVSTDTKKVKGIGVFDPKTLVGKTYGAQVGIGDKQFYVLLPSVMDKLFCVKRKAQIILPRDAASIILNCSLESGHRVVEAGIGSGSLTIALAHAVAPNGQVFSYDIREDFIDHAEKNVKQASCSDLVTIKQQDITKAIIETDVDAVVLDIANPWDAVEHAWKALKMGGYFCAYSPLISQVENTVKTLRTYPFIEIVTFEHIQREMIVGDRGTRPSFHMLGHTGYLTFGRKVLSKN